MSFIIIVNSVIKYGNEKRFLTTMPKAAKRNSDHTQKHHTPTINNQAIASHLEELLTPAIFAQQKYYKQLGLRDRIINLSFMVAAVLTLLWRQVPGVQELTRLLAREDYGENSYRGSGKLQGKAAIITGGDSGIGRAVALAFAREGADVLIAYLREIQKIK